MKSNLYQEDAMGAISKTGKVRGGAHKRRATPPRTRDHGPVPGPDYWDQTAKVPDARDDEIDCERIVHGGDARTLPLYYDDYN